MARQPMRPDSWLKHMEAFKSFVGGMNTTDPESAMSDAEVVELVNMDISDRGALTRRTGMRDHFREMIWRDLYRDPNEGNLLAPGTHAMNVDSNGDGVADGFTAFNSGTITATRSIEDNAQKITAVSSGSSGAWASVYHVINVIGGQPYSFSVEAKTGGGTAEGRFYVSWYDDIGSLGLFSNFIYIPPNSRWKRHVNPDQVAPVNATKARLYFQVYCRNGGETGSVWFKRARFEEGSIANPYDEQSWSWLATL